MWFVVFLVTCTAFFIFAFYVSLLFVIKHQQITYETDTLNLVLQYEKFYIDWISNPKNKTMTEKNRTSFYAGWFTSNILRRLTNLDWSEQRHVISKEWIAHAFPEWKPELKMACDWIIRNNMVFRRLRDWVHFKTVLQLYFPKQLPHLKNIRYHRLTADEKRERTQMKALQQRNPVLENQTKAEIKDIFLHRIQYDDHNGHDLKTVYEEEWNESKTRQTAKAILRKSVDKIWLDLVQDVIQWANQNKIQLPEKHLYRANVFLSYHLSA